jgi:hypothetical protein
MKTIENKLSHIQIPKNPTALKPEQKRKKEQDEKEKDQDNERER